MTAAQLASEKRPVLIYIHGGSFDSVCIHIVLLGAGLMYILCMKYKGSGYSEEWASVAQRLNVVVVSFNYRLSILGFLAVDRDTASSVNLGIQDQREALKWINASIADFGGDRSKVYD